MSYPPDLLPGTSRLTATAATGRLLLPRRSDLVLILAPLLLLGRCAAVFMAVFMAPSASETSRVSLPTAGAEPAARVAGTATAGSEYVEPQDGHRLVAVRMTLTDQGQAAYTDAPCDGARLIDADGPQDSAAHHDVQEGRTPAGSVTVSPGDRRRGLFVFELPVGVEPVMFRFGPESGFAEQKGEWALT